MAVQRTVSTKELRAQVAALEPLLLRTEALSSADAKANKPGGTNNPQLGALGWLRYLIVLQRAHAVHVGRNGHSTGAGDAEKERLVMDALRAAPEDVELHDLDPATGVTRRMMVFPKSHHALIEIHKLDMQLGFLAAAHDTAREMNTGAASLDLMGRALTAINYHYGLLAWAVTAPGPGLPWPEDVAKPELPAHILALSPLDLYAIAAAYQRVNNVRLVALEAMLTSTPKSPGGPVRPSWAVFFAVAATELNVRPESLLREWSLGAVLSALRLSRDAKAAAAGPETTPAHRSAGTREVFE